MNKNIKATNMELTPAISDYIDKKFDSFDRFVDTSTGGVRSDIEVGKTTRHHKQGDVFRAEVNLHVSGQNFYAVSEREDLYAAIDEVKDEIIRQVTEHKDKSMTLMRKGALRVKNIIKGLDWRNWKK